VVYGGFSGASGGERWLNRRRAVLLGRLSLNQNRGEDETRGNRGRKE